jgi:asparagine synthase (glutamine-hydrolysing)
MSWALAATYGSSGEVGLGRAIEAVTGAMPQALSTGLISIAAAGGPLPASPDRSLCALAGSVYDTAVPAAAAGLDPALPVIELLGRAHARIGDRVLDGLRGDFCLILYDPDADEGFVARDHMGGFPVYWQTASSGVQIASDPKIALELSATRPGPDVASVAHWISPSGIPADRTMYSGLHRLAAGHMLRLRAGRVTPEQYWSPVYAKPRTGAREVLVSGLRDRLQTAVDRRTPATGGAVLLSGGVDSSTVGAFASLQDPRLIDSGYSAVFPDHPTVDEAEQIDQLADGFGFRSVRAEVRSGSVLEGSLGYLERFELPPISPNLFFWIPLFEQAAADGATALLDGEGGDEVFGLSPMLIADRVRRGRLVAARRLIDNIPGAGGAAPKHVVREFMREYGYRAALPGWTQQLSRRVNGPDRYTEPYLLPDAKRAFMSELDGVSWKKIPGPRWWSYLVDITTRGQGPAFVYEHVALRARMAGVEARHPLVDADLIEYVLSLPPEAAWDHNRSRPLVREATAGLLPEAIRIRPDKSSFDAVFHAALAGPDLPVLQTLLGGRDTRLREFVDLEILHRELLDAGPPPPGQRRQRWALKAWRLATAELWLRYQEDPEAPRRLLETAGLPAAEVALTQKLARKWTDKA